MRWRHASGASIPTSAIVAANSASLPRMNPVTPSVSISGAAPRSGATTGVPQASASASTRPNGPSHCDGKSTTFARRSHSNVSGVPTSGRRVTAGPRSPGEEVTMDRAQRRLRASSDRRQMAVNRRCSPRLPRSRSAAARAHVGHPAAERRWKGAASGTDDHGSHDNRCAHALPSVQVASDLGRRTRLRADADSPKQGMRQNSDFDRPNRG